MVAVCANAGRVIAPASRPTEPLRTVLRSSLEITKIRLAEGKGGEFARFAPVVPAPTLANPTACAKSRDAGRSIEGHTMDVLTAINSRASAKSLGEPGPTPAQLETILSAGVRAPDHGRLSPWRF